MTAPEPLPPIKVKRMYGWPKWPTTPPPDLLTLTPVDATLTFHGAPMPSYSRDTILSIERRWILHAPAHHTDIEAAIAHALQDRETQPGDTGPVQVTPSDEHIIVSYTARETK